MIPLGPVVARTKARVDRAVVWEYLVDAERRKAWWPELRLDPRVGGAVTERWAETSGDSEVSRDASGEVDVWVEGHAIGFRWSEAGDGHSTAVLVTLRSSGPDTKITVTETGFDALPSPAESAAASQEGWQVLLTDLVETVEVAVNSGQFVEDAAPVVAVEPAPSNEEPPAEEQPVDEQPSGDQLEEPVAAAEDDEQPEEPDFDDLIRGPQPN